MCILCLRLCHYLCLSLCLSVILSPCVTIVSDCVTIFASDYLCLSQLISKKPSSMKLMVLLIPRATMTMMMMNLQVTTIPMMMMMKNLRGAWHAWTRCTIWLVHSFSHVLSSLFCVFCDSPASSYPWILHSAFGLYSLLCSLFLSLVSMVSVHAALSAYPALYLCLSSRNPAAHPGSIFESDLT